MKEQAPEETKRGNEPASMPLDAKGAAKLIEELEEKERERQAIKDSDEFKNKDIH